MYLPLLRPDLTAGHLWGLNTQNEFTVHIANFISYKMVYQTVLLSLIWIYIPDFDDFLT